MYFALALSQTSRILTNNNSMASEAHSTTVTQQPPTDSGWATVILEPTRKAYEIVDNRRRRSFYILLSFTCAFAIVLYERPPTFKIPPFAEGLELLTVLAIAPAFIAISTVSYLYLSAHTYSNYIRYLELLRASHDGAKDRNLVWLHVDLKQRDVTESMNPFSAFAGYVDVPTSPMPALMRRAAYLFQGIGVFAVMSIPACLYVLLVMSLVRELEAVTSYWIKLSAIAVYTGLGIGALLSPVYFFYRIKGRRLRYKQERLALNRELGKIDQPIDAA